MEDLNAASSRLIRTLGGQRVLSDPRFSARLPSRIDPVREAVVLLVVLVPLVVGVAQGITSLFRAESMLFYIAALVALVPYSDAASDLLMVRRDPDGQVRKQDRMRELRRIAIAGVLYYAVALGIASFHDRYHIGTILIGLIGLVYVYRLWRIGRAIGRSSALSESQG